MAAFFLSSMTKCYLLSGGVLCASGLLPLTALAQAPVIIPVIPMANARAAARTSPVTVNFSQPLTAALTGTLKVFGSQRGGLRSRGTTPAVVNGNALSFAPTAWVI